MQMLSNTLRLNFFYLKINHILHPRYHPKLSKRKKCGCIHTICQNENEDENEK